MNEKIQGFIMAVHRDRYQVFVNGQELYARLKTGIYYQEETKEEFPTVGDWVMVEVNPIGDSLIWQTLPRKTVFSRKDPDEGRGEQVIAANFDYVFIMMSLNYDFNVKRLERYLTVAWQSGAQPVVILTKADIAEKKESKLEQIQPLILGVPVHFISALTGEGMEEVKAYLKPEVAVVFLGSSGVGKSTLTNYLLGKEVMKTSGIREEDSKGHHTTTHRQMFLLENGVKIIDTPGMRELGMWVVDEGVEQGFADIYSLMKGCKFANCTHQKEPGCAIRTALSEGTLTQSRWRNYEKIQKESDFQKKKERISKLMEKKNSIKKDAKPRMKKLFFLEEE